jgi:parvulin-like peptidyl-prolyl isomerase
MAKGQKSQLVTKKHLARQERERRQNRYILIASIAVIVIVVGLIGYGIVQQYILQPNQPVAKVTNKVITTKQFQTYARYLRLQLIQQYQRYQQFAQLFGNDQASQSYIQQYLEQINYQLESTNIGQSTLDYLIANQIIQKEADSRDITVSEEEINKKLQDYFLYFPEGTPTTAPTSPAVPTSTLNPTQIALIPPTATAVPTATNTPTPVITTTQEVAEATPTVVNTPTSPAQTSTPLPTPTEYTLSSYKENLKTYMTDVNTLADLSEADFRWVFGMQLLSEKVFEAITANISREQDQVWARHILVSDEVQAQAVYERLSNGENFESVATTVYSGTDTTNPIDLGWFSQGVLESNAEKAVFDSQIGQILEPIQTADGWEIYQILGHEIRTLSDSEFQQLQQTQFQKWLDEHKAAEDVQTFDIWKTRVPVRPTIPPTQPAQ